jgi:hypothetical protein
MVSGMDFRKKNNKNKRFEKYIKNIWRKMEKKENLNVTEIDKE